MTDTVSVPATTPSVDNSNTAPAVPAEPTDAVNKAEVYVGNLPKGYTSENLKTLFADAGEIKSVKIIRGARPSSRFGLVLFSNESDAEKVINSEKTYKAEDTELKIRQARPKGAKSARRGFRNQRAKNPASENKSNSDDSKDRESQDQEEGEESGEKKSANNRGDGRRRGRGRGRGRGRRLPRVPISERVEVDNQIFLRRYGGKPSEEEVRKLFEEFSISSINLRYKSCFITVPNKDLRDQILNKHKETPYKVDGRDLHIEVAHEPRKLETKQEKTAGESSEAVDEDKKKDVSADAKLAEAEAST
ncbi:hypothetical protein H4219_000755 [Mycoemilia scoparia]|uniref:RRM domain-containing protein n=1 Tax=Mycoemilia scoparia TaxID=417184 RepID=A0A9W8A4W2_9FUNG|nr:hypothetical protein H4219_000755 [Mycoemilia scoparia]